MIGRGSYGAPWSVGAIAKELQGLSAGYEPVGTVLGDLVIEHYESTLDCYGEAVGIKCMRKHLGWYLAGRPGGADLRSRIIRSMQPAEVIRELSAFEWPEVAAIPEAA